MNAPRKLRPCTAYTAKGCHVVMNVSHDHVAICGTVNDDEGWHNINNLDPEPGPNDLGSWVCQTCQTVWSATHSEALVGLPVLIVQPLRIGDAAARGRPGMTCEQCGAESWVPKEHEHVMARPHTTVCAPCLALTSFPMPFMVKGFLGSRPGLGQGRVCTGRGGLGGFVAWAGAVHHYQGTRRRRGSGE